MSSEKSSSRYRLIEKRVKYLSNALDISFLLRYLESKSKIVVDDSNSGPLFIIFQTSSYFIAVNVKLHEIDIF